jgi:alcohol dehydrogenase (cytochrome c)
VEWNGPTLDRLNNTLVTGSVDVCFIIKLGTTQYSPQAISFGGTVEPDGPTTGWVTALDAETGAVRWRYQAEKPVIAGVTPTAGGVVFTGDLAGNLLVFDSKTGELVHKANTGGALAGGVVTYEIAGRQYVAFASGNVSRTAFGALGLPSVVIMSLNAGRGSSVAAQSKAASGTDAESANLADGRKLYGQVCVSCHGPDGNMLADHQLGTLAARQDRTATIGFIKNPKLPMPKLYPDLLTEQNVADVAAYVHEELGL